jgi:hypothetical protein
MVLFGAVFGWALLSGGEKKSNDGPDRNPEVG